MYTALIGHTQPVPSGVSSWTCARKDDDKKKHMTLHLLLYCGSLWYHRTKWPAHLASQVTSNLLRWEEPLARRSKDSPPRDILTPQVACCNLSKENRNSIRHSFFHHCMVVRFRLGLLRSYHVICCQYSEATKEYNFGVRCCS